ncbi:MAG: DUF4832 domain-containing protein [Candidatus Marinimicrobia bacterium]|nr:DUF4832 domain-containing protein [Candidatus Neomarinimicrobiota bacterium]MCF7830204.1 DUF4832 domain-containing protein [Candidatus Neomarinimicrobiota bacterium]MCF7880821.1 DUF4832 domain-containing protein [Candidatus Neomarinimicrobiota bacterium]
MNVRKIIFALGILSIFSVLMAQVDPFVNIIKGDGTPNVVLVSPRETDEVLVNPGMGFTTHNRFNGEVAGYPESSIAYFRWYWEELEPQEGQFNWDMVDSVLAGARAHGQRLATRIMPANGRDGVPEWYKELGAKGYEYIAESTQHAGKTTTSWMPDHSEPLYAKYMGRLVREFAKRYDGHPDIDHIDIGSYGHWGEWHLSFVEEKQSYPFEIKKMIIDWYLENFKKTPLVIAEDAEDGLEYAAQNGVGWRADCMGDYGPPNNWNLMTRYLKLPDMYPSVGEAWKTTPVAFETCGTMESWLRVGRDIEYIYSVCLELHASVLNNKSTPIPPEWWPATEKFLKRMGYRLVPRLIRHEKWLSTGDTLHFEMELDNIGVAPPYRAYVPVVELRKAERGAKTVLASTQAEWNVKKWLPGRHREKLSVILPGDAKPGRYLVYFSLLDPIEHTPAIQLAVEGGDAQKWYSWSALTVAE